MNSALWTVVVDLHFYLLLPLIALVIARFAKGSLAMGAAGLGLMILASFGVWDYATNGHLTPCGCGITASRGASCSSAPG